MDFENIGLGNWGDESTKINSNFNKTGVELIKLNAATVKFKGYFILETSLLATFPSPKIGYTAWVGATYPGVIYICQVAGAWLATTQVPPVTPVDLTDYVKLTGDQELAGLFKFSRGAVFKKGVVAYGEDSLLTGVGRYVTAYVSATYGSRILSYDGATYYDLSLGARVDGKFGMVLKANGETTFGHLKQESGTDTEQVMSQAAVTEFVNGATNIYNVTNKIPLGTGLYYTATTARLAIPTAIRKPLLTISYLISETEWVEEQFIGTTTTDWTTEANWRAIPKESDLVQLRSDLNETATSFVKSVFGYAFRFRQFVDTTTLGTGITDLQNQDVFISVEDGTIFGIAGIIKGDIILRSNGAFIKSESLVNYINYSNALILLSQYELGTYTFKGWLLSNSQITEFAENDLYIIAKYGVYQGLSCPQGSFIKYSNSAWALVDKVLKTEIRIANVEGLTLNIDGDAFVNTGYYDATGTYVASSYRFLTNKYGVNEGDKINVAVNQTSGYLSIIAFDASENVVLANSVAGTGSLTVTDYIVPVGIAKVAFGCWPKKTARVVGNLFLNVAKIPTLETNIANVETQIEGLNTGNGKEILPDEFTTSGYFFNTDGHVSVNAAYFYTPEFYKVNKGDKIEISGFGGTTSAAKIAAYDKDGVYILESSLSTASTSAVYVVPDGVNTVRFCNNTPSVCSVKILPRLLQTISDIQDNITSIEQSIELELIKADLTISAYYNTSGVLTASTTRAMSPLFAVKEGYKFQYAITNTTTVIAIAAFKNGVISVEDSLILTTTGITVQGLYIVPVGVTGLQVNIQTAQTDFVFKRLDSIVNKLVVLDDISNSRNANLIDLYLKDFTLNSWTLSGNELTSPISAGLAAPSYYPTPLYEDEFLLSCKMKAVGVDGFFEIGIGKNGTTVGIIVTLCKDVTGSYLRVYKRVSSSSFIEVTANKTILSETLEESVEYVITIKKITNTASSCIISISTKNGVIGTTTVISDAAGAWGNPAVYSVIGTCIARDLYFSVPYSKTGEIIVVGDSFIEGNTLQGTATKDKRYAALLQTSIGLSDCAIFGHGGGSTISEKVRVKQQLRWFNRAKYCIVALGTNDVTLSTYKANILDFIFDCENYGITPILVTITPRYDVGYGETWVNSFMLPANEWIKGLGYNYVDANEAVTTDGVTWKDGANFGDNIHPSVLGHELIYNRALFDCPFLGY